MGTATILGTAYNTVIMPDGNEWMTKNLYANDYGGRLYQDNATLYPGEVFGRLYPYIRHGEIAAALAGTGWRIPTNEDWLALINACGIGDQPNTHYNGSSLRSIGSSSEGFVVWDFNGGGTDLFGFRAYGSGRFDGASSGGGWKENRSVGYFASGSPPYPYDPMVPNRRRYPQFLVTGGTGAPNSPKCVLHVAPAGVLSAATENCCVAVRLVRAAPRLHVVHDGAWKRVSEQHQINGGWVKSSKIFVPSSGAWAQS